ncbi:sensor histidine kinase [Slackia heliotrinireducens]|uniref:sensor histidine kinase n=1 Tax=Slackia heliotrinireducens TaxID=84110 RepID=UPI00331459E7
MNTPTPKSIRGKMTLFSAVATFVAMVLVVAFMGVAMRLILEDALSDALHQRMDQAAVFVEQGNYTQAVDSFGVEIVQLLDADGRVVAESDNARGMRPIDDSYSFDADGETRVSQLHLQLGEAIEDNADDIDDDEDDEDTASKSAASNVTSQSESDDDADEDSVETYSYDDSSSDADDDAYSKSASYEDDAADYDVDYDTDDDQDYDTDYDEDSGIDSSKATFFDRLLKQANRVNVLPIGIAWADTPNQSETQQSGHTIEASSVLGDNGPYLIVREAVSGPDGPMTLIAVTSLASAFESAKRMTVILTLVMLALLVSVVGIAWAITGWTLRPVEHMRSEAATITAESLDRRIDAPDGDKDLSKLAETLNHMLARIQRSVDEQKRFVSDASHELKSPIAATSIILDSMSTHPENVDVPKAIADLKNENVRMSSIVGDMLTLTRHDEGRLACRPEPVDLMDMLIEEVMASKSHTSVNFDISGIQPVVCKVDPDLLSHAVRNLLENAVRYAESTVKVSCSQDEEGAVSIRVSDDGCGIPPEDRERVFGRFVCLGENRADSKGGTGLGLAVVKSIVESHGGTVAFVEPELSGATAEIRLPLGA